MEKENIFKNAYFGKPYKTRSGKKALYLWSTDRDTHSLMVENCGKLPNRYNSNGKWYGTLQDYPMDIISEWTE